MNAFNQWLRTLVSKPVVERRSAPRLPFTSSIEVRTLTGAIFRGIGRDLSVRGLGAIVFADLQVGDSVVIKYPHPNTHTTIQGVRRNARVKARYGNRYGFEFEDAMECALNHHDGTAMTS